VFAKERSIIEKFVQELRQFLEVNEVTTSCFLGVEIDRLDDSSIILHQRSYIKMLERYSMAESRPKDTPLELNHPLNKSEVLSQPIIPNEEYAAAIGSLLYCALATRPDIAHSLTRKTSSPTPPDLRT
jgi:hypothetical protein